MNHEIPRNENSPSCIYYDTIVAEAYIENKWQAVRIAYGVTFSPRLMLNALRSLAKYLDIDYNNMRLKTIRTEKELQVAQWGLIEGFMFFPEPETIPYGGIMAWEVWCPTVEYQGS